MATPEGRIKAKFKAKLKPLIDSGDVWSFWPVQSRYGGRTLDNMLCVRGRFVLVEFKRPGGELTAMQNHTKALVIQAGGVVFVVDNEEGINRVIYYLTRIR